MGQDEPQAWADRWALTIRRNIASARDRRGLSARALSERCAELGYPIARSTLASIENGDRRNVTLPELGVIAAALDVPPVALLYPLDSETVEVLPGEQVPPLGAVQWFSGEVAASAAAGVAYGSGDGADPIRALEDLRALGRLRWDLGGAELRLALTLRERLRSAGYSVPESVNETQLRAFETMSPAERAAKLEAHEARP